MWVLVESLLNALLISKDDIYQPSDIYGNIGLSGVHTWLFETAGRTNWTQKNGYCQAQLQLKISLEMNLLYYHCARFVIWFPKSMQVKINTNELYLIEIQPSNFKKKT